MKKLTLTESQLTKIIAQVINEQADAGPTNDDFTKIKDLQKFITELCGMDIVAMGDKKLGGRKKCDGNKTDGSGGCYEPLIKLVKEYCKTK
jgi:hypothetical protein|tara:strand:- start:168 stop:440 length:273 start_codon:yes stop_codon:yes gene_type:complete